MKVMIVTKDVKAGPQSGEQRGDTRGALHTPISPGSYSVWRIVSEQNVDALVWECHQPVIGCVVQVSVPAWPLPSTKKPYSHFIEVNHASILNVAEKVETINIDPQLRAE